MKNIILDFDSTLVTIEGIDELARMKGVYHRVKGLTDQAMNGQLALEAVFARRLQLIKPTVSDLTGLARLYLENITPGAAEFVRQVARNNRVFVVTGGYRAAILPTTRKLGIPDCRVFANELQFDDVGNYAGYDQNQPLWKEDGKAILVARIRRQFPHHTIHDTVIIGDGQSDAAAVTNGEIFIQFRGVIARPLPARPAQIYLDTFEYQKLEAMIQ